MKTDFDQPPPIKIARRPATSPPVPARIAATIGAGVVIAAIVVLFGWLFDIVLLKSIRSGWPNMKPATALGFMLGGTALWCTAKALNAAHHGEKTKWRLIARICAAIMATLGLLKLGYYWPGWNLNFNPIGFQAAPVSPVTSLNFLLLGSALLLTGGFRGFRFFQSLTFMAGLIGWMGFARYLYGGEPLAPFAQMAIHTSLLFLALSAGILCTRTNYGLMALLVSKNAGGMMARRLLLLAPLVPLVVDWLEEKAEQAGWLGNANSTPLFSLIDVILLATLIWITGIWLQRVDARRALEEAERRENEERLRLFVEHAPAAIAMLDTNMRYIAVSRRWLADYRLGEQAIVGRSHYNVFPEIPQRWREIHRRCLAGAVEKCEEDPFPRADGSVDWVRWEIRPWHRNNGAIGGIIMFSEVITERKRAEEEIKFRNTILQTQQETSLDAILVVDENQKIISYNRQFVDLWRLSPQIVSARLDAPVLQAVVDQVRDSEAFLARVEYLYEHRNDRSREEIRLKDGRIIDRYSAPMTSADGNYYGRVWYFRDITERTQAAEKIRRLNRVYAVLSETNSLIVRVKNRQMLFDDACRIAVEHGNFGIAWIGLFDTETSEVTPVASANLEKNDSLLAKINVAENTPHGQSVLARAIRERHPVYSNDLAAAHDTGDERRQEILRRGYHSVVALPLIVDGLVAGSFVMLTKEPGFFDEEELKLLNELAGDISFALDHLEKREKLEYLSYYDPLTNLPNRTLFLDRLNQQLRARSSEPRMVALILLNIDRFRMVNETLGHHGGDELLRAVAQRLEWACDNLARIGADGFGVIIRGARDATDIAHEIENRILPCFREPYIVGGTELRISAKIGLALFPADGDDTDTLFKNAEAALKKAKASGDRYLFYAPEMNAQAAQVLSMETRLRKAMEARQFLLHYQPKVKLADHRLTGLEALIRWQDPGAGLIPPGNFIPLLEETGLVVEVGQWALTQALADYRDWTAHGYRTPRIAVNVSAVQLRQSNFTATIIDIVQNAGDIPEALELEITESLMMQGIERNVRAFAILRGMGIHVAMDDFGTGYSSLNYLTRLPIDKIKIDRSFIAGMIGNPQDKIVVSTIITLAHSFGLPVVAEGVETEEQAEALKKLGCDEAQGYFFSKPLPAAEIGKFLEISS